MTGKYSFNIDGVEHSVWFGMTSVNIFQRLSTQQLELQGNGELDNNTSYATLIYAGLCNNADVKMVNRPSFERAYEIAEAILDDEKLQTEIYKVWEESKPVKEMMDRLNKLSGSVGKKKEVTKKITGTK